jgi:hypothetical protein
MRRSLFSAASIIAFAQIASAADLPVKAPPGAAITQSGGFYVWADGSYQSVKLPAYGLGLRNIVPIALTDLGPTNSFDPRATGYGVRGAVGYVFSPGTFAPMFGSDVRFEIGASYVNVRDSSSGAATFAPTFTGGASLLSGATFPPASFLSINCTPGAFNCATAATLDTRYRSWDVSGKLASDFKMGTVTLTPSVAVFGGNTRNNQSFAQSFSQHDPTGLLFNTVAYNAATLLDWTDVGARAGLDAQVSLNSWLSVGAGGSIGFAHRSVSLSGSDGAVYGLFGPIATAASAITADADKTALKANVEGNVTVRVGPRTALRVFAGLNYDNNVPGVSSPTFSGPFNNATSVTPAGISFSSETSYYAGGGALVRF